jgi:hypothetical protein
MRLPRFLAKKRGNRRTGSQAWGSFAEGIFYAILLAAGVVGVAGEGDGEAGLAGDGGDGGGGLVELFEDATLFDVEFDVAASALRRVVDGSGVLVPAFSGEGGGEGDAVDVHGG